MDFKNRVAIVTGAGAGLGRAHALELARQGAAVVVNDLAPRPSAPATSSPAEKVVEEITALGGAAFAYHCDVSDAEAVYSMVGETIARWGRIDILINNAGILRDKSFAKSAVSDFRAVLEVHLLGSVNCSQAVWPHMVEKGYGRILMTTSASGIYGNFGQANYGAAKAAVVGLMNVLAIEGERKGIKVNSLAPTAATDMTRGLIDDQSFDLLDPSWISPGAVFLVSAEAPTKTILAAGAGVFAVAEMRESAGIALSREQCTADNVAMQWAEISDMSASVTTGSAFDQTDRYTAKALALESLATGARGASL